FRAITFELVAISELPAWAEFFDYAVQGGKFSYYPDANSSSHQDWTLEDTAWKATRAVIGYATFTFNVRLVVGDSGSVSTIGGGVSSGTITAVLVTAPGAGDFDWPHGVTGTITAAIPVETSSGLLRLQDPGY